MKKETKNWIFKIILVGALVLVGVAILSFQTTGFSDMKKYARLGDEISIKSKLNSCSSNIINFDGSYLPNDSYSQVVKVYVPENEVDCVIRVNAYLLTDKGEIENVSIQTPSTWLFAQDGYYYYQNIVKGGEIINFSRSVKIPDIYLNSQNLYSLIFNVETIKLDEYIIENLWNDTPLELKEKWII